jgi:hydrogenase maturation protease
LAAELVEAPWCLVLGIGNPLRGDDGAGAAVVDRLLREAVPERTGIRLVPQLTPELAEPVGRACRVVFVDASVDVPPGAVSVACVAADCHAPPRFTHALAPGELLAMAGAIGGRAPAAFLVSIGAESFDAGQGLTGTVRRSVAGAATVVRQLLREPGPATGSADGQPREDLPRENRALPEGRRTRVAGLTSWYRRPRSDVRRRPGRRRS